MNRVIFSINLDQYENGLKSFCSSFIHFIVKEMKWRDKRYLSTFLVTSVIIIVLLVTISQLTNSFSYNFFNSNYDTATDDDFSFVLYDTIQSSVNVNSPSLDGNYKFKLIEMKQGIFKSGASDQIPIYLSALKKSIRLLHLPTNLSRDVINRCRQISTRGRIDNHQHSLELHFPRLLYALGLISPTINHTSKITTDTKKETNSLFTYVASFAYHAIYCTRKSRGKEDWTQRDPYWLAVAEYLKNSVAEFGTTLGSDYLITASHPLAGPSRIHPAALSYLHRATFLRTDFDFSGSAPKDIIIPYYYSSPDPRNSSYSTSRTLGYKYFIYFTGGDNPIQGYRSEMKRQIDKLIADPQVMNSMRQIDNRFQYDKLIHFSTDSVSSSQYTDDMSRSVFCLCVRGDTTSSRRLFTSIALGCIPVIIADFAQLPFERLLDYSRFTVRVPESAISNMSTLVQTLLVTYGDPAAVANMRAYLSDAAKLLMYPDIRSLRAPRSSGVSPSMELSLLNPVTLTLIEALMRREEECRKYTAGPLLSDMCLVVYNRLSKARASYIV